jgi:hypothetical protein
MSNTDEFGKMLADRDADHRIYECEHGIVHLDWGHNRLVFCIHCGVGIGSAGIEHLGKSGFDSPTETFVERSQVEIEQFLALRRLENRKKLEELPGFQK